MAMPPTPYAVAQHLLGAMNAKEPPDPIGWVTVSTEDGTPLYVLACVQGEANAEQFRTLLEQCKTQMQPVEPLPHSAHVDNLTNRG